ncbi:alpha/beta fold hydrolase [Dactylosporangium sp. NPDC049742]|uniref:alpha/beta fold hydrolase n=1 Tax=Dactylosporangium sp. NPDC049742 TaxID=3154737 RepID=UPI003427C927
MPAPFLLSTHRAAQHRLAVDGGQLAYLDLGPRDGHPVLLLHGTPTSSWLYRDVAARLAAAGFRAIAPDLLGYGASDKPADHSLYTPHLQAERIVAILDHLGLAQVTMAVHDLGGPVGFEIAETSPTRIAGLVVLNTTAYADAFRPPLRLRMLGGPLGPPMLAMMAARVSDGNHGCRLTAASGATAGATAAVPSTFTAL